jgi:hypothetical protein
MRRNPVSTALLAGLLLLSAAALSAELIVFEDGRVVKAAGYTLLGEELEIRLPGGGSYRVDLSRGPHRGRRGGGRQRGRRR